MKFLRAKHAQSRKEMMRRTMADWKAGLLPEGMTPADVRRAVNESFVPLYLSEDGRYQVAIFKDTDNGFGLKMTHLSIKRVDKAPIHDWRDLQAIKNFFLGEECEAIEVYPKESRRVDSANQYHLWGFPDGEQVPVGFTGKRYVTDTSGEMGSVNRKLEEET